MSSPRLFERQFYGSAVRRDRWLGAFIKGSVVRSRRRYLDERDRGAQDRIRAQVGPEARAYLDTPPPVTARVPYAPLVEIDAAIVECVMAGDVARMRDFGRDIASHDLTGLYRAMLRTVGRASSLGVYAMLFRLYWEPGRLVARAEPDATVITMEGLILPRYMCRYGVTGYLEGWSSWPAPRSTSSIAACTTARTRVGGSFRSREIRTAAVHGARPIRRAPGRDGALVHPRVSACTNASSASNRRSETACSATHAMRTGRDDTSSDTTTASLGR